MIAPLRGLRLSSNPYLLVLPAYTFSDYLNHLWTLLGLKPASCTDFPLHYFNNSRYNWNMISYTALR
jgi:hypothetical protein